MTERGANGVQQEAASLSCLHFAPYSHVDDGTAVDEMKAIKALAERWRRDATTLRCYGCAALAEAAERHAAEMIEALAADDDELLTAQEAAAWSGYTTRHLRGLDLPNHGRKGSPLYRRGDLPCKPGHDPERAQRDATAVLTRMAS